MWADRVARMGETRNSHEVLVQNLEGNKLFKDIKLDGQE
jgi:hypothetical protein